MSSKFYYIKLYLIIPLIFAGISILSSIVAHRVTMHYVSDGVDPYVGMFFWGGIIGVATFLCGVAITRMILGPVERFVVEAVDLGVASHAEPELSAGDEMDRYTRVFKQVTDVLDRVEARELFPDIIGQSKSMRRVLSQIKRVAPTDITVLITGESGTGKELVANNIYNHSLRKGKRYIKINCAAIPAGLLESELFGHEKGAFTGALSQKKGKFELASGGTVFLDEIGDMPLETQAKILRVLEEREVDRVGGNGPVPVDVRIIAASNRNLEHMVKAGTFREDLFFRLNVFNINLPSLRDRPEDIPFLVEEFIKKSNIDVMLAPAAMQALCAFDWPGNVRELRNTLESAFIFGGKLIDLEHLSVNIIKAPVFWVAGSSGDRPVENCDMDVQLAEIEKGMILDALGRAGGTQVTAAAFLGIKERSLWHRIKKYNIDISQFKGETKVKEQP